MKLQKYASQTMGQKLITEYFEFKYQFFKLFIYSLIA